MEAVVAGAQVRRLDSAELVELLERLAPELLDMSCEDVGRRQATDEEPEVEALDGARLGRLQPARPPPPARRP